MRGGGGKKGGKVGVAAVVREKRDFFEPPFPICPLKFLWSPPHTCVRENSQIRPGKNSAKKFAGPAFLLHTQQCKDKDSAV